MQTDKAPVTVTAEDREYPEFGRVQWHCSEEDGGPDVGILLGLGNGQALWLGELLNSEGGATGFAFYGDKKEAVAPLSDWNEVRDLIEEHVAPAMLAALSQHGGGRGVADDADEHTGCTIAELVERMPTADRLVSVSDHLDRLQKIVAGSKSVSTPEGPAKKAVVYGFMEASLDTASWACLALRQILPLARSTPITPPDAEAVERGNLYAAAYSALRFAASRNAISADDERAILASLAKPAPDLLAVARAREMLSMFVDAAKPRGQDGHHDMPKFSATEIDLARAALAQLKDASNGK